MSEDGIISSSGEAQAVGFKAVKKVTGVLQPLKRKESNFKNDDGSPSKDQVELSLDDAIILEMLADASGKTQPIPELKEDRFVDWMPYAKRGEQPTKQSSFVRGFVKSAEKLWEVRGQAGKGWRELVGEVVTLEKQPVKYVFDKGTDKERKEEFLTWHFVENTDMTSTIDNAITASIAGKTPQMAARDLMMDARTKNQKQIITDVKLGKPVAGLEVVDGKYQATATEATATETTATDDGEI